eukprot:GILI01003516.1.p1 GENE.GILI01003516.1~~GILI01003516.1.p1  ORF type:complete len:188 (-),score=32.89 GILI01003516.1:209-718(-)
MQDASNLTPKEIKRLHKRFRNLDKDQSGELEPSEFFDLPELAQNPLVQRVISVFDRNHDGKVSFVEFVQGLSLLSSHGKSEEKLRFAFSIYDVNGDGFISNGDLFSVMKMMVGSNLSEVQLQQLVDRTILYADADGDGKLCFEEFVKVVEGTDLADKLTINISQASALS